MPRSPDTITVAGRRLETLELAGDPGPPALVLLHEALGSIGLWRDFPAQLHEASGRRVLAFSRAGHGRSDPPGGPRTPAFFAEEADAVLPEVLAKLEATAPVLVGHSDGASIALLHAARHPVAGAVLIAPHVVVEQVTVDGIAQARERYRSGDLRERLARHHDDPDVVFGGWCDLWLDPSFRDWSIEDEAGGVTAPLLLVQGADDAYGTLDQLERIERGARGPVRRLVLPGGHAPHFEQADRVIAEIARFADGL